MSTYHTIWGVYHANGGPIGELAYVLGKLRGTAHCALCDVTHGSVRKKPAFKALERTLEVPTRLVHLDEQPAELARVTEGSTPCVVGEGSDGFDVLLGPEALEACQGSVERFAEALDSVVSRTSRGG